MEKPAWNADLLDWLAEDLADHGYDVKHVIEIMLTSRAYQLPSVAATEITESSFVFHGPLVRRMSAEQFRDAVGSLTDVWYTKPNAQVVRADGTTNHFALVRAALVAADPLQVAMGRPNREQVVTSRASTATTLEALELTNGAELAGVMKTGAEKILAQSGNVSPRKLVPWLYEKALGRKPSATELGLAKALVGQPVQETGVEDLLWSLAMLPEFQLIY